MDLDDDARPNKAIEKKNRRATGGRVPLNRYGKSKVYTDAQVLIAAIIGLTL